MYACQISTINEAADDETNNDVNVHEIWWYEVSELIVSQQTLFKFKHIRYSSLLANTNVSVNDVIISTEKKYCIWLSLKVCLSIKWNVVKFVIMMKMTVLLRSSIDMLTWKRYCIWLSLKVCLSIKWNVVQSIVVTKMTVLLRSSVNMST